MTTAPRSISTLEQTLDSLENAGWDDVQIFAEPGSVIPTTHSDLRVSRRAQRMGAFPNWILSLTELYFHNPDADAYFLCQDDVIFARGLRSHLERELWPASRVGIVSVYASGERFARLQRGFHRVDSDFDSVGALGYVFPGQAVRSLLGHPSMIRHRSSSSYGGIALIDSAVARWSSESGLPAYVHCPSLAQHIGDHSTIHPTASNTGNRRAIQPILDLT